MEPDLAGEDLSHYDERSFWWRHEKYHRTLITASRLDPQPFRERDEVESKLVEDIATHKGRQLTQIRRRVQADVLDWEKSWKEKFEVRKSIFLSLHPFTQFWKRQNRLSGMIL